MMTNAERIKLEEARLNRLERNDRANFNICKKIRRRIYKLSQMAEA